MTTTAASSTPADILFRAVEAVSGARTVVISAPQAPITIKRIGGTETMTVDNWTLDGSGNRNIVAKQPFAFRVGGTLHVGANQAEGLYVGTFNVEVQFP